MISRIAHICVNVSSIEQAKRFYGEALGMAVKFTFEKPGGRLFGVYFHAGGDTYIEAFEVPDLKVVNTGLVHFCLETDDIDGMIARLQAHGVACTPKKLGGDHSWQCWIQDPDGNRMEFHQYTEASFQRRGGVVHC